MSRYLVDRISGLSNVEVLTQTNVTGIEGRDGMLEAVRWRGRTSGEEVRRPIRHLFLFIGADPNTDWMSGSGTGGVDEALHHRAWRAVLQRYDSDWRAGDRQLDRQFPDERMPVGELQLELRKNCEMAAGPQEIGAHFEGGGDHGGARKFKPTGSKSVRDERPERITRWGQRP